MMTDMIYTHVLYRRFYIGGNRKYLSNSEVIEQTQIAGDLRKKCTQITKYLHSMTADQKTTIRTRVIDYLTNLQ